VTARRDAAVVALAFEFAGRLQDKLEALDWITGEQKVTLVSKCSGGAEGFLKI